MARARDGLATRTGGRVLTVSFHDPTLVRLEHAATAVLNNASYGTRSKFDSGRIAHPRSIGFLFESGYEGNRRSSVPEAEEPTCRWTRAARSRPTRTD
jgi:hypothetical protein